VTTLRWGSASDTGRVRAINQDAALAADPIFAVADGMGGHAAGEVASQVAVEALRANVSPSEDGLVEAIRLANRQVIERAGDDPELRGMGTTLCAIALVAAPADADAESGDGDSGARVIVANVGDSRVYVFHDDDLLQISEDHSLVEDLVRQGRLSPEEARVHPQKNIVTRVLGNEPDIDVDTWEIIPYRGDRFLLCSDGLSNEVDDRAIAGVLRRVDDPDRAARELVRMANEHGGRDNITVVVVDVVDDGGRSEEASAALAAEPGAVTSSRAVGATAEGEEGTDPPPTASAGPEPGRGRRVTFRSALFVFALLAVGALAVGSVLYFSRTVHHVGLDDGEIVIFQGRPGGVLWITPELVERTGVSLADVPPARHADLADGKQQPSLEAAQEYVSNLEEQGRALRRTTTTTSEPEVVDPPPPDETPTPTTATTAPG
jgi:PPM family protein phosphatase